VVGFLGWVDHKFTDGPENNAKLRIVLLLQFIDASGQDLVRTHHFPQAHKRPHDG